MHLFGRHTIIGEDGKEKHLPPGTSRWGIPVVGDTLNFSTSPFLASLNLSRKYGPVVYSNAMFRDSVLLSGSEALKYFYDESHIQRKSAAPQLVQDMMGASALPLIDNPEHQKRRERLAGLFQDQTMVQQHIHKLNRLLHQASKYWEQWSSVEMQSELFRLAGMFASLVLFGNEQGSEYAHHIKNLHYGMSAVPLNLPGTGYHTAINSKEELKHWINAQLDEHLSSRSQDMESDALHFMLRQQIPREEIVGEVFFLLMGFMSLASAWTNCFIAMAEHPECLGQLERNIEDIRRDQELSTSLMGQHTGLSNWINEVRRFYPLTALSYGKVKETFSIGDVYIPKSWTVIGCFYATNHGPDYNHPDEFDPSRFNRGEPKGGVEYGLVPQGGGRSSFHRCMGEDLTVLSMAAVVVHLVRDFKWDFLTGWHPLKWWMYHPEPVGGVRMQSFRRKGVPSSTVRRSASSEELRRAHETKREHPKHEAIKRDQESMLEQRKLPEPQSAQRSKESTRRETGKVEEAEMQRMREVMDEVTLNI